MPDRTWDLLLGVVFVALFTLGALVLAAVPRRPRCGRPHLHLPRAG